MSETAREMTREELFLEVNVLSEQKAYLENAIDSMREREKEKDKRISEMQSHIDCLKAELAEIQMNKQELPLEPLEVATMLVKATITRKATPLQKAFNANLPDEYEADRYSDEDLRQIATHLLVYCNHAEVE